MREIFANIMTKNDVTRNDNKITLLLQNTSTYLPTYSTRHYGKKSSKIGKILGNPYQINIVPKFIFLGMF